MDTRKPQNYSQNRSFQHNIALQVLEQCMTWEEGDTVLDVGCGTGELCKFIAQQPGVASVVGFDLSPDFISHASQHNSAPNVSFHVADASDISTIKPDWQGAFSKVVSILVIHWIQDRVATMKVLHSCLKSGGEVAFICDIDDGKFSKVQKEMASHPKWKDYLKDFAPKVFPWPSSDLVNDRQSSRLLEECGFEVLSCEVKEYQYPYDSMDQLMKSFAAVLPHLNYIPKDKHEEFFYDLERMSEHHGLIPGEGIPMGNLNLLLVHARKL